MTKFIKRIKANIKQIKINKNLLKSSLSTSIKALLKMLLLYKLKDYFFYKPMAYALKLFLKWIWVTGSFSLGYSVIQPLLHWQFDLTSIFAIGYALFLVFFDAFSDYTYEYLYKIKDFLSKIVEKVVNKLESDPKTIKHAEKVKTVTKNNDLLTHSKDRIYNQKDLELYHEAKMSEERYKKPSKTSYGPDYSKRVSWLPFSFSDFLHYAPYILSITMFCFSSYYFYTELTDLFGNLKTKFETLTNRIPNWIKDFLVNTGKLRRFSNCSGRPLGVRITSNPK